MPSEKIAKLRADLATAQRAAREGFADHRPQLWKKVEAIHHELLVVQLAEEQARESAARASANATPDPVVAEAMFAERDSLAGNPIAQAAWSARHDTELSARAATPTTATKSTLTPAALIQARAVRETLAQLDASNPMAAAAYRARHEYAFTDEISSALDGAK